MFHFIKKLFGLQPAVNFKTLLSEGAIIVDVRSFQEFKQGHLKNALNIPLNNLTNQLNKLPKKDQIIITCCASGMRSANGKSILNSKGYTRVYNGGGWMRLQQKLQQS